MFCMLSRLNLSLLSEIMSVPDTFIFCEWFGEIVVLKLACTRQQESCCGVILMVVSPTIIVGLVIYDTALKYYRNLHVSFIFLTRLTSRHYVHTVNPNNNVLLLQLFNLLFMSHSSSASGYYTPFAPDATFGQPSAPFTRTYPSFSNCLDRFSGPGL